MAEVETSIHFLTRDRTYEHEKPYQLKYTAAEGIPTTNIRLEKQAPIRISSMRGQEQQFPFEKNGFTVLKMNKEIPYVEFNDPAGVKRYLTLVAKQLRTRLGADKVQLYQYVVSAWKPVPARDAGFCTDNPQIRKRDPDFPIAKNKDVWKPLRGPLRDWPLALCDASTVHPNDLIASDNVFDVKVTENMQVHYDSGHKWYYLEDQESSELLVFRQADSHPAGRVGVPHTSFLNPKAGKDELPRESIEVRTLVSYGDVD
ncbi:MAG: hypothetical protein Q9228_003819 [Teloschistes exilis]